MGGREFAAHGPLAVSVFDISNQSHVQSFRKAIDSALSNPAISQTLHGWLSDVKTNTFNPYFWRDAASGLPCPLPLNEPISDADKTALNSLVKLVPGLTFTYDENRFSSRYSIYVSLRLSESSKKQMQAEPRNPLAFQPPRPSLDLAHLGIPNQQQDATQVVHPEALANDASKFISVSIGATENVDLMAIPQSEMRTQYLKSQIELENSSKNIGNGAAEAFKAAAGFSNGISVYFDRPDPTRSRSERIAPPPNMAFVICVDASGEYNFYIPKKEALKLNLPATSHFVDKIVTEWPEGSMAAGTFTISGGKVNLSAVKSEKDVHYLPYSEAVDNTRISMFSMRINSGMISAYSVSNSSFASFLSKGLQSSEMLNFGEFVSRPPDWVKDVATRNLERAFYEKSKGASSAPSFQPSEIEAEVKRVIAGFSPLFEGFNGKITIQEAVFFNALTQKPEIKHLITVRDEEKSKAKGVPHYAVIVAEDAVRGLGRDIKSALDFISTNSSPEKRLGLAAGFLNVPGASPIEINLGNFSGFRSWLLHYWPSMSTDAKPVDWGKEAKQFGMLVSNLVLPTSEIEEMYAHPSVGNGFLLLFGVMATIAEAKFFANAWKGSKLAVKALIRPSFWGKLDLAFSKYAIANLGGDVGIDMARLAEMQMAGGLFVPQQMAAGWRAVAREILVRPGTLNRLKSEERMIAHLEGIFKKAASKYQVEYKVGTFAEDLAATARGVRGFDNPVFAGGFYASDWQKFKSTLKFANDGFFAGFTAVTVARAFNVAFDNKISDTERENELKSCRLYLMSLWGPVQFLHSAGNVSMYWKWLANVVGKAKTAPGAVDLAAETGNIADKLVKTGDLAKADVGKFKKLLNLTLQKIAIPAAKDGPVGMDFVKMSYGFFLMGFGWPLFGAAGKLAELQEMENASTMYDYSRDPAKAADKAIDLKNYPAWIKNILPLDRFGNVQKDLLAENMGKAGKFDAAGVRFDVGHLMFVGLRTPYFGMQAANGLDAIMPDATLSGMSPDGKPAALTVTSIESKNSYPNGQTEVFFMATDPEFPKGRNYSAMLGPSGSEIRIYTLETLEMLTRAKVTQQELELYRTVGEKFVPDGAYDFDRIKAIQTAQMDLEQSESLVNRFNAMPGLPYLNFYKFVSDASRRLRSFGQIYSPNPNESDYLQNELARWGMPAAASTRFIEEYSAAMKLKSRPAQDAECMSIIIKYMLQGYIKHGKVSSG